MSDEPQPDPVRDDPIPQDAAAPTPTPGEPAADESGMSGESPSHTAGPTPGPDPTVAEAAAAGEPTGSDSEAEVDPVAEPDESDASTEAAEPGHEAEPPGTPDPVAEVVTDESTGDRDELPPADDSLAEETISEDDGSGEVTADAVDREGEPAEPEPEPSNKKWYVVKVTSGREDTIKAAIERRVKIEGLEEFYGQIVVPVERVTVVKKVKTTKNGEKITKETRGIKNVKKYPGYIMAEVEFNDRILYLFRETSGVGDFVGAAGPLKPPAPMTDIEVRRMLGEAVTADDAKKGKDVVVKLDYEKGDKVRIREGAFANMEGEVKEIAVPKDAGETPKVKVEVTIFGRGVPVDLDYWQVDKL